MATPLIPTARIRFPTVEGGLTHVSHFYVRNATAVGSTWNINTRATDANDLDWVNAAQGLADALSYAYGTARTAGAVSLEQLSGGVWVPLAFTTVTLTNKVGGGLDAEQITMTFRDKTNKKVKVIILEGNQAPPQHLVDPAAGDANFDNLIKQFMSTFTVTNAPYNWLVGRNNQYLATSPFVAATVTLNRKVRRARGLA